MSDGRRYRRLPFRIDLPAARFGSNTEDSMWHWTRRIMFLIFGLLIIGAFSGGIYESLATRRDLATTPHPGQLVDVGGHRLHIWCTGTGAPPVILEAGLGGSTVDWGFVQP